ncbi:hypothetical protein BOX15_Mlig007597g1 [Macrostomum lignano]|uniref:Uncharacterized protein n=1 Tax=Macrostomum lignano TaxID=282301 RepID=A0A267E2V5_9PLAT|nr:hypothetical protein BOX15_Mlig007597g1 [Macrostomum lignano]
MHSISKLMEAAVKTVCLGRTFACASSIASSRSQRCGFNSAAEDSAVHNSNNNNSSSGGSSDHLGADPSLVSQSLAAARRVLSGAYSRQTLLNSSSGSPDFSVHEFQLAASCCIYGNQRWRNFTIVCTGGQCGVELLTKEFQPPGSGQMVSLTAGKSVSIPAGQPYYLCGHGGLATRSRLLLVSVPALQDCELQDVDGSYPAPPAVPPVN